MSKEVFIVSAVRTPIGSFGGTLADTEATILGAMAIKAALNRIHLDPKEVNEVFYGQVLQAGAGQAPVTQACFESRNTQYCTRYYGEQSLCIGYEIYNVCRTKH